MKAIILAAGYGTRLKQITRHTPKPFTLVARKSIVQHIIEKIVKIPHLDEIIIVTNNFFNQFVLNWVTDFTALEPKIKIPIKVLNDGTNTNEERLGAVGDIHFTVMSENIDDDIFVIGGDNLFEFNILDFYKFFIKKGSSVVALHRFEEKSKVAGKFGIALIDNNSKIIEFEEKPENPKSLLASTACYFFTKADVKELEQCIAEKRKPDNLGDFIKWLSEKGDVYGFVFSEKWIDIGSPEQLNEARDKWGE